MGKKAIWAENEAGHLFVRVSAVMTPIIVLMDGLRVSYFGKAGPFLLIDDAIAWLEKEISYAKDRPKYLKEQSTKLQTLQQVKHEHETQRKEHAVRPKP
jgi:hypothetical protein